MARIKNDFEYKAIMKRVDELFFETNESTPSDDPRLVELDVLSSLVEEYEKETIPIKTPSLGDILSDRMEQVSSSSLRPKPRGGLSLCGTSALHGALDAGGVTAQLQTLC